MHAGGHRVTPSRRESFKHQLVNSSSGSLRPQQRTSRLNLVSNTSDRTLTHIPGIGRVFIRT